MRLPQDCAHNVSVWAMNKLMVCVSVAAAVEVCGGGLRRGAAEEALCADTLAERAG